MVDVLGGRDLATAQRSLLEGWSLPSEFYTDPTIFAFERSAVFGRRWQYLAPAAWLEKPGMVVVDEAAGWPVVVTRGSDGQLHGMLNACRHRGYRVVEGSGEQARLQCGYHGWIYRLDGSLARVPHAGGDFDISGLDLQPVAVDTFGCGVFINLDPAAPSLRSTHLGLAGLDGTGLTSIDPEDYRFVERLELKQSANWKLWYDNGVECYHCTLLHGQSFAAAFGVAPGSASVDATMDGELYVNSYRGRRMPSAGLSTSYCHALQLFPGCQIVLHDDLLVMAQARPVAVGRTDFVADFYAPVDADVDVVRRWIELWTRTYEEDAVAIAIQQQNFDAGAVSRMRYVAGPETPVLFFNQLILDAYRSATDDERLNP